MLGEAFIKAKLNLGPFAIMEKLIKALLGILNTKSVFEMLEWERNAGNRNMKLMANIRSI